MELEALEIHHSTSTATELAESVWRNYFGTLDSSGNLGASGGELGGEAAKHQ